MVGGVIAALTAVVLSGGTIAQPIPTPIGVGPQFRLAAAPPGVAHGEPVGRFRCSAHEGSVTRAHVELFANRRVLLLPAGIGMAEPLVRDGAFVRSARCTFTVWTTAPTGVVEFPRGTRPTVGELFAVWGQPLSRTRFAGFRGRVAAFVDGRLWRRNARAIPLLPHAQVVLEVGGYVRPHPFFLFGSGR